MDKKYFPIKTETACPAKWAWSTLSLNRGLTKSCHRTSQSELTTENFFEFHNTPLKIKDRESMLRGEWPEQSCKYCKNIESRGESSDRTRHLSLPYITPVELQADSTATHVSPTLLEVYFNNVCNLGCLYCHDSYSSTIEAENKKFGIFQAGGVKLHPYEEPWQFKNLVPLFWQWFETGFLSIKRLHLGGGELFYQKEFFKVLDFIDEHPNADCEFNIITNLMVSHELLQSTVERFKNMLIKRKLKRVDITCSIDCWGEPAEYVRWGLKLDHWEKNFQYLLKQKWLTLNINQTIIPLTIKTMPALINKLKQWRLDRPVGHFFSGAFPVEDYLKLDVLGEETFAQDIKQVLDCMPQGSTQDIEAYNYMNGILSQIKNTRLDVDRTRDMITYLDEKDRRRGTNWRNVFPWLTEIEKNVV